MSEQTVSDWRPLLASLAGRGFGVPFDEGRFDMIVMADHVGQDLVMPQHFTNVRVLQRGELLVAMNDAGEEVTRSLVIRTIERVPRSAGAPIGLRAYGQNADTFAKQNWVIFPPKARA